MSPKKPTRRATVAEALDNLIPPSLQRTIISLVVMGWLAKMGITVDQNGQVAQQAAASIEQIQAAFSNELARSYEARRKTWTLSNDVARLEGKIDRLLERQ